VKVVAIAPQEGMDYILPSVETVNSASYPIARDLYVYTRQEASVVIDNYLKWILSPEAQQIVTDLGFVPVLASGGENIGEP
jgi:phosphate transport system substrate-binding protein